MVASEVLVPPLDSPQQSSEYAATYYSDERGFSRYGIMPVNEITPGPLHALHLPDGKPATEEVFWYEPDYVEKPKDISRD